MATEVVALAGEGVDSVAEEAVGEGASAVAAAEAAGAAGRRGSCACS